MQEQNSIADVEKGRIYFHSLKQYSKKSEWCLGKKKEAKEKKTK